MAAGAALSTNVQPVIADAGEYMLQPGLSYLSTGSLGPTPRSILDAVLKAWNQLEVWSFVFSSWYFVDLSICPEN